MLTSTGAAVVAELCERNIVGVRCTCHYLVAEFILKVSIFAPCQFPGAVIFFYSAVQFPKPRLYNGSAYNIPC